MRRVAFLGFMMGMTLAAGGCSVLVDGSTYGGDASRPPDGAPMDSGSGDAGVDSGRVDGGSDSGADSGVTDSGTTDSGPADSGVVSCTGTGDCTPPWEVCSAGSCLDCDQDGDFSPRDVGACMPVAPGVPRDCNDTDPTVFPGAMPVCGDSLSNSCPNAWLIALRTAVALPELDIIRPLLAHDMPAIDPGSAGRYAFSVVAEPLAVSAGPAGGQWMTLWANSGEPMTSSSQVTTGASGLPTLTTTGAESASGSLLAGLAFPFEAVTAARARSFGPSGDNLAFAFTGDASGLPLVALYESGITSSVGLSWRIAPSVRAPFSPIDISMILGTPTVWWRGLGAGVGAAPHMERAVSGTVGARNPRSVSATNTDATDELSISAAGPFAATGAVGGPFGSTGLALWDGEAFGVARPGPFELLGSGVGSPTLVMMDDTLPGTVAAILPRVDGNLHLRSIGCGSERQSSCAASDPEILFPGGSAHAAIRLGDHLLIFSAEMMAGEPTVMMRAFSPTDLSDARLVAPTPIFRPTDTPGGFTSVMGIEASLGPVDNAAGTRSGREVILGIVARTTDGPMLFEGALRACDVL